MDSSVEIVTVDATNVAQHGFFCYKSKPKSEGHRREMKYLSFSRFISVLLVVVVLGAIAPSVGSDAAPLALQVGSSAPGQRVILLHDDRYIPHCVLPPMQAKLGIRAATYAVNWNPPGCWGETSPWPQDAKTAFNFAIGIWSSLLDSSQTIVVDACWRTDLPEQHIAEGGATTRHHDFDNAPMASTWYVAPLANELANSDINDHDGWDYDQDGNDADSELGVEFNRTFNWYFGADGNPPRNKLDFASTVLHEICHGLGFIGETFVGIGNPACETTTPGDGCLGWYGYPMVYDHFTEDGHGRLLLDYPSPSVALGNALTGQVGGGVYFDGRRARAANRNAPVKLYAPNPAGASSYSHLDEIFNGTSNSLMTHRQLNGVSEHHPGSVTLGMLQDMGWAGAVVETTAVHLPLVMNQQPPVSEWITILSEDFEGPFPGSAWLVLDENSDSGLYYWGKRDCRSSGGSFGAWSVGAGDTTFSCGSNSPNDVSAWMVYGPFSLADATAAELIFDWWSETELDRDHFTWGASTDDYHYHGARVSGDHSTWTRGERLDLSAVPVLGSLLGEEQVWIGFSFQSGPGPGHEGSYVDNVRLRKQVGGAASGSERVVGPQRVLQPNQMLEVANLRRNAH